MRVYVAGASGQIGARLVPQLVAAGHEVVAATRSTGKVDRLRKLGAEGVVVDGLDREAVIASVMQAEPDAVVHEMTALSGMASLRRFDDGFALTNRLRTEGTDHLLEAARLAGVGRVIAQSYAGWPSDPSGPPVQDEEAPLDPSPVAGQRRSLAAIRHVEAVVPAAGGIVLRYGALYGADTSVANEMAEVMRKRRLPVIGSGAGIWSFVHVWDAAAATVLALERGGPGIYNVVDDEPAAVTEWLPALADAIGAPPPRRVPVWLGRLAAGDAITHMMTRARGCSNAKAKRDLGWRLRYPTWRTGFRTGLGE
jgi:nucleoside-diphosphate-sugar epimerase